MRIKLDESLSYPDVGIEPGRSDVGSRAAVDLATHDGTNMNIPVVAANMIDIVGVRLARRMSQLGGLAVFHQDMSEAEVITAVAEVKNSDPFYETPATVAPGMDLDDALDEILGTEHGAALITSDGTTSGELLGTLTAADCKRGWLRRKVRTPNPKDLVTMPAGLGAEDMFGWFNEFGRTVAPVTIDDKLVGVLTEQSIVRSFFYSPALDSDDRLMTAAAVGINGGAVERAISLSNNGVDVIVVDTAHAHQEKALDTLGSVHEKLGPDKIIVAGNAGTQEAVYDLVRAGADIVKIGIGPGAMCSTRKQTGVGLGQFTTVVNCAAEARRLGKHAWADGGIINPGDVSKAIGAGAVAVMIGSKFAGSAEAASPLHRNGKGRRAVRYKENKGMASLEAVLARTEGLPPLDRAKAAFFVEGIHGSKYLIDPSKLRSVGKIMDEINAGLRSTASYVGALNMEKLHELVVFVRQTAAAYNEGQPRPEVLAKPVRSRTIFIIPGLPLRQRQRI